MTIKKDIFGNEPQIGDIIVLDPPGIDRKGMILGQITHFSPKGYPVINCKEEFSNSNKKMFCKGYNLITRGVPFIIVTDKYKKDASLEK